MSKPLVHTASITIGGLHFRELIAAAELHEGIARVASELVERYRGGRPLMICVLNGAALFYADLIRLIPLPLEVDYVRVASYHGKTVSSGMINFTAGPGTQIAGRNVIVVEDIVDSGRTVQWLREYFLDNGAASVEVATLLYKPDAHRTGEPPEYIAFEIADRFVIGFGLDYQQEGRNLPSVFVLDDHP